jgi:hypothetical protein
MMKQMNKDVYQWSKVDKMTYLLSLIPLIAVFIIVLYVLTFQSIYLSILFLSLYVIVNFFQSYCCIDCPYKGSYCPAFFGVYLGNMLSSILFNHHTMNLKTHKLCASLGALLVIVTILFPIYWLYQQGWIMLITYIGLVVLHVLLFAPTQCKKCSYQDRCPGGKATNALLSKKTNR